VRFGRGLRWKLLRGSKVDGEAERNPNDVQQLTEPHLYFAYRKEISPSHGTSAEGRV